MLRGPSRCVTRDSLLVQFAPSFIVWCYFCHVHHLLPSLSVPKLWPTDSLALPKKPSRSSGVHEYLGKWCFQKHLLGGGLLCNTTGFKCLHLLAWRGNFSNHTAFKLFDNNKMGRRKAMHASESSWWPREMQARRRYEFVICARAVWQQQTWEGGEKILWESVCGIVRAHVCVVCVCEGDATTRAGGSAHLFVTSVFLSSPELSQSNSYRLYVQ